MIDPDPSSMPTLPSFVDLLDVDRVFVRDPGGSKAEVLQRSADRLAGSALVTDRARLASDLEAREQRLSTGVGEGLALPHARTPAVSGTVATLATLSEPVEWSALDGEPVDLVVTFAAPESEPGQHVRLMAQISRVLSAPGVRDRLADAGSAYAALEVVRDAESSFR
ncbi:PTS sugar transporter subunit IIA [Rubrivirga sp.]|uniref:PTS sugar transporter subunit IIA n=1 Tax=Rubrivirga sp. TaxID=1885344 RepID=UPI003C71DFFD